MATVISHFYNESYLLPFWLRHHRSVFEHGILIDYHSTDESVSICEELVPDWDIRTTRNNEFDALQVDREILDIESEVNGWKIALNTTEFLCGDLQNSISSEGNLFSVPAIILVDGQDRKSLQPQVPLVDQCWTGFFESDYPRLDVATSGRSRFLHRLPHGNYTVGRHSTQHPDVRSVNDLAVFWFGFAPWTDELRKRKLQIQDRMSDHDKGHGFGIQHITDMEQLETLRNKLFAHSTDLRQDPRYRSLLV